MKATLDRLDKSRAHFKGSQNGEIPGSYGREPKSIIDVLVSIDKETWELMGRPNEIFVGTEETELQALREKLR